MTALTSFPTALSVVSLMASPEAASTTGFVAANGTGVDLEDYEGLGLILMNISPGTDANETITFTLEDSADNSSFAAITAAVGATALATAVAYNAAAALRCKSAVINVNQARRYLRVVCAVAGTTPCFTGSISFAGIKKQR